MPTPHVKIFWQNPTEGLPSHCPSSWICKSSCSLQLIKRLQGTPDAEHYQHPRFLKTCMHVDEFCGLIKFSV